MNDRQATWNNYTSPYQGKYAGRNVTGDTLFFTPEYVDVIISRERIISTCSIALSIIRDNGAAFPANHQA